MTRRFRDTRRRRFGRLLAFGLMCWTGCSDAPKPDQYVARVGDTYLTQEEIDTALSTLPANQDSAQAVSQFIDQWIANHLLEQEARRYDLDADPEIRRLLEDNERSVLVSAFIDRIYEETPEPTAAEIRDYFETNRDRLQLRESYVRIRFVSTADSAEAIEAYEVLRSIDDVANPDSTWQTVIDDVADDPAGATVLSTKFFPEARLFGGNGALRQVLSETSVGEVASPLLVAGQYYVFQVVERISEGTLPRFEWVEDEIRQRLTIQKRKQMYTDQVERLKNEALVREELESPH